MSSRRLVAATYNIHRCLGRDGRNDPERIARVIRSLGADVVGLQEVDSEVDDQRFDDQLELLSRATGMQAVAGPTLRRDYGGYGNGLLTRLPVVGTRRHELPSFDGLEPRGALEVDLRWGGAVVRVLTTHLGLRAIERRSQVRKVADLLERATDGGDARALIVMGDFNEWNPLSRIHRLLERAVGAAPAPATFPARLPLIALDRIRVRPPARLVRVEAVRDRLARTASDHLPLKAWIAVGPDESRLSR